MKNNRLKVCTVNKYVINLYSDNNNEVIILKNRNYETISKHIGNG